MLTTMNGKAIRFGAVTDYGRPGGRLTVYSSHTEIEVARKAIVRYTRPSAHAAGGLPTVGWWIAEIDPNAPSYEEMRIIRIVAGPFTKTNRPMWPF